MSAQPDLTVLVPAYNEQQIITQSIAAITAQLSALALDYEILVVDDGSRDETAAIVQRLAAADERIRLERHPANLGIGAGIRTGIRTARGQFMIFIPADLGMDLSQLSRYVEASPQADIVLGNRSDRRDYTVWRRIVSLTNILLLKLLFGLKQSQFSYINLYRLAVVRQMRLESKGVFISHELIVKARDRGARIVEVPIDYLPRPGGEAKGARISTVLQASWETGVFWLRWLARTLTGQRSRGYLSDASLSTRGSG